MACEGCKMGLYNLILILFLSAAAFGYGSLVGVSIWQTQKSQAADNSTIVCSDLAKKPFKYQEIGSTSKQFIQCPWPGINTAFRITGGIVMFILMIVALVIVIRGGYGRGLCIVVNIIFIAMVIANFYLMIFDAVRAVQGYNYCKSLPNKKCINIFAIPILVEFGEILCMIVNILLMFFYIRNKHYEKTGTYTNQQDDL
eukprot:TRINITY_DN13196_c0_g1_i1.p1 TRINITY_DN13196_c0_g1~~TRINITY_DN13196_c0_g1_i1.p1  ORF type:complete len:199 (-),score=14.43 TRINITY_DN13196_c0_g1_i1:16-612(-)